MYVFCVYPEMSKKSENLSDLSKKDILYMSLGAGKSKGLNRIAKSDFCNRLIFAILFRPFGLLAPV
jgi:hypothetical protein